VIGPPRLQASTLSRPLQPRAECRRKPPLSRMGARTSPRFWVADVRTPGAMTPSRFFCFDFAQCRCWLSSPQAVGADLAQWGTERLTYESGMEPYRGGLDSVSTIPLLHVRPGLCDLRPWRRCSSIPWAVGLQQLGLLAFIEALIFISILVVCALAYAWRKGAPKELKPDLTTMPSLPPTPNPLAAPGLGAPSIRTRLRDLRAASCNRFGAPTGDFGSLETCILDQLSTILHKLGLGLEQPLAPALRGTA